MQRCALASLCLARPLLVLFLSAPLLACSSQPPPCVELEVKIVLPPGIAPPRAAGSAGPGLAAGTAAAAGRTAAPPPYGLSVEGRGTQTRDGLSAGGAPAQFCLEPGEWRLVLTAGTATPTRALADVVRPGPVHLVIPPPTLP